MLSWIRRQTETVQEFSSPDKKMAKAVKESISCSLEGSEFFVQFGGASVLDAARKEALNGKIPEACALFLDYFRERIDPIFFLHNYQAENLRTAFHGNNGIYDEAKIQTSNILSHKFSILGCEHAFKKKIDWFSDLKGNSWPKAHISILRNRLIEFTQQGSLNHINYTWEFNKHYHFLTLARACILFDNQSPASEFVIQALDWSRSNGALLGVNWLDQETAATRLINWLTALNMLAGSPSMTPEAFSEIMSCAVIHGASLAWFLTNDKNKSLAASSALYLLALTLPELKASKKWLQLAENSFRESIPASFCANGMHISGSTLRHLRETEWLVLPLIFCCMNRISPNQLAAKTAEQALGAIRSLYSPAQHYFAIGEAAPQGLLGQWCSSSEYAENLLAAGAIALGNPRLKYGIGFPDEMYWWFGPDAKVLYDKVASDTPPAELSLSSSEAGIGIARNGWDAKSSQCIFRTQPTGRTGLPESYSFAELPDYLNFHDDMLSFLLTPNGEPLIIEPGSSTVYDANLAKTARLCTHSSLRIKGELEPIAHTNRSIMKMCSDLKMEQRGFNTLFTSSRLVSLPQDVKAELHRDVLFQGEASSVIIRDTITSKTPLHGLRFEYNLMMPQSLKIIRRGDSGCFIRGKKLIARLIPIFPSRVSFSTACGLTSPFLGWRYSSKGQLVSCRHIRYIGSTNTGECIYMFINWEKQEPKLPSAAAFDKLFGFSHK